MHLDLRFAMKKFGRSEGPALPNLLVTGLGWGVNGGADNSGLSRRESQAIVLSFFLPLWLGWAVMLSLRSPVYVGGRASTKGESESEIARFFRSTHLRQSSNFLLVMPALRDVNWKRIPLWQLCANKLEKITQQHSCDPMTLKKLTAWTVKPTSIPIQSNNASGLSAPLLHN